jgi:hypothetical protein
LKNFSKPISKTNAHMHANEDIWEIGQIKELGVVGMKRPATRTRAAMELAVTRAGITGPVMTWREVAMIRMTRAVMTTGPVVMPVSVTTFI